MSFSVFFLYLGIPDMQISFPERILRFSRAQVNSSFLLAKIQDFLTKPELNQQVISGFFLFQITELLAVDQTGCHVKIAPGNGKTAVLRSTDL